MPDNSATLSRRAARWKQSAKGWRISALLRLKVIEGFQTAAVIKLQDSFHKDLERPVWDKTETGYEIKTGGVHAWIEPRQHYCDRGRWQFNVDGLVDSNGFPAIDGQDMFPRYFFDLERCKLEAEAFLRERKAIPGGRG